MHEAKSNQGYRLSQEKALLREIDVNSSNETRSVRPRAPGQRINEQNTRTVNSVGSKENKEYTEKNM